MKLIALNFIFTVYLFFSSLTVRAQTENYDNHIDKNICAKNKIKEIVVYEHYEIEKEQKRLFKHWLYNEKGLCIESFFYPPYLPEIFPMVKERIEPYHELFSYNKSDSLIQHTGYVFNYPVLTNFTYENKDKFTLEKSDSNDIWIYRFDSIGKLTQKAWYMKMDSERLLQRLEKYDYDNIGRKIRTTAYNPDSSIFYYEVYEFDSSSNLRFVKQFREKSLRAVWEYIYKKGNVIEFKYSDLLELKNSFWHKYIRNDKGLVFKETGTLSGNKNVYEREYEYKYYD